MIVYYWLAAIGVCFIMKHGSILEQFRQKTASWFAGLGKLYQCCLCMGFWVGLALIPFLINDKEGWGYEAYLFPFTCSAVCWFADSIMSLIHTQTNYLKK